MKNKAAIYCRLSVEDYNKINKGDDSESIVNQKIILSDYALNEGWEIYQIYVDEDFSGLDRNRPQFNKMIKDAKNGLFDIILCKSQSRFTRDMELVEKYINRLFIVWGIRFISITDCIDTNVKGNKKARQINGLINEWFCEDLSENINTVFKKKMELGQYIGSFACYGYLKNGSDKHKLIIDEYAAKVVKLIFNYYLEGKSCSEIANILTLKKIHTPTVYKKMLGLNFYNPNAERYNVDSWSANTVRSILKNRIYIGDMVQGKNKKLSYKSDKVVSVPENKWIVVESTHEPIISNNDFYAVQKMLKNHRRISYTSHESNKNIFTGKIFCADCKSNMQRGSGMRNKNGFYMRCGLYHKSRNSMCTSHSISSVELESFIYQRLYEFFKKYYKTNFNFNLDRKAVNLFINSIIVNETDDTGKQTVIIKWNF